jgi:uncharacterized protein
MDITPIISAGKKVIQGYGDGGFTINHERMEGSYIIFPEDVQQFAVSSYKDINVELIAPVIIYKPNIELLLIGTGPNMQMLGDSIRIHLKKHNIALEYMDTGAACRTYNILLAEGRDVAAVLVAV